MRNFPTRSEIHSTNKMYDCENSLIPLIAFRVRLDMMKRIIAVDDADFE